MTTAKEKSMLKKQHFHPNREINKDMKKHLLHT